MFNCHLYALPICCDTLCVILAKNVFLSHNSCTTSHNNMGSSQLHHRWHKYSNLKKWICAKMCNLVFLLIFIFPLPPCRRGPPPCVLASSGNNKISTELHFMYNTLVTFLISSYSPFKFASRPFSNSLN